MNNEDSTEMNKLAHGTRHSFTESVAMPGFVTAEITARCASIGALDTPKN